MPSTARQTGIAGILGLLSSAYTFTAPADGWIKIAFRTGASETMGVFSTLYVVRNGRDVQQLGTEGITGFVYHFFLTPVLKSDTVQLTCADYTRSPYIFGISYLNTVGET